MKKERKPKTFIQSPTYPGGSTAMRLFLNQHLKYPAAARKEKIEGTVRLRMDIDYKGKVTAAKLLTSLGHGCDEEAKRVVKLLQFEVPKQRKIKAVFHKIINIHFKYKKEKVTPAPEVKLPSVPPVAQTMQYTVVKGGNLKGKITKDSTKGTQKGGYNYTVDIKQP